MKFSHMVVLLYSTAVVSLHGCNHVAVTEAPVFADSSSTSSIDLSPFLGDWDVRVGYKDFVELLENSDSRQEVLRSVGAEDDVLARLSISVYDGECSALQIKTTPVGCDSNSPCESLDTARLRIISYSDETVIIASVEAGAGKVQVVKVKAVPDGFGIYLLSYEKLAEAVSSIPPVLDGTVFESEDDMKFLTITASGEELGAFIKSYPDAFEDEPIYVMKRDVAAR